MPSDLKADSPSPSRGRAWPLAAIALLGCGQPSAPEDVPAHGPEARQARSATESTAQPPSRGAPRFSARRQVRLGAKPRGLAAWPTPGRPADLLVLIEEPGQLLLFTDGELETPKSRFEVGAWGVGPLLFETPEGRLAATASMATRELELTPLDPSRSQRRIALGFAPVDLTGWSAGGQPTLWVLGRAGELLRIEAGAESGRWQLPIERATAIELDRSGHLWVAAQAPALVLGFKASELLPNSAAPAPFARLEFDAVPRDLAQADVLGNGHSALFAAIGEETLAWIQTKPDGASARTFKAPGKVPMALFGSDLDGDGREELLDLNRYDTNYGVLGAFDEAAGRFGFLSTEYAGQSAIAACAADFDGDGKPDLAIANRDALAFSILPGTGLVRQDKPVFYSALRLPVGSNPLFCLAADLDGDRAPEALSLDSSSGQATRFLNRYGRLESPLTVPIGTSPRRAVAADLDGDGDTDIAVLCEATSGSKLVRLLGDGRGGLTRAAGDIDAGRSAALIAWAASGPDATGARSGPRGLLLGDPTANRLGWLAEGQQQVLWIEIQGAPRAFAIASGPDPKLWVAVDGSQPALALWSPVGSPASPAQGLTWHEVERRPAPKPPIDLAVAHTVAGPRIAWLGALSPDGKQAQLFVLDPGAPSSGWSSGPVTGQKPIQLAAGDLDGDGNQDLALAVQNEHALELYRLLPGAGDPGNRQPTAATLGRWPDLGAGLGCFSLCLADLDQNGLLDVLAANAFSHDLSAIYALEN